MDHSKVPAVLSIAGSDSSGGAGIQADIKTITAHRLYAETASTAITAQNTLGVTAVQNVSPDIVAAQIDAVLQYAQEASVLDTGLTPGAEDHILTLVTCTGHGHASRWIVQAVRTAVTPLEA